MLLPSEVARLKYELGYNGLTTSALPYAIDGITALFEQVVQPYLQGGEVNFSSTPVAASESPQLVTLELQAPTKIQPLDRLMIDKDDVMEFATATVVTPTSVQVRLMQAHVGTFPVVVEGAEAIVRQLLRQCVAAADQVANAMARAGLKKVEDIEFFAQTTTQDGVLSQAFTSQRYWRNELASCLGIENLREIRAGATNKVEAY